MHAWNSSLAPLLPSQPSSPFFFLLQQRLAIDQHLVQAQTTYIWPVSPRKGSSASLVSIVLLSTLRLYLVYLPPIISQSSARTWSTLGLSLVYLYFVCKL